MTAKSKKAKRRKKGARPGKIRRLHGAAGNDLSSLAEETREREAHWNRPRKKRISLRVDLEVLDWFQSKGPGYQTRINRILRKVMREGKRRERDS